MSKFVDYEISKRLKEKGFSTPCFFAFDNCSTPMRCSDLRTSDQKFNGVNYNSSTYTSQPSYDQVIDWFELKGIFIELIIDSWGEDDKVGDKVCYRAFVWQSGQPIPGPADDLGCSDRYTILDVSFKYALDLL